MITDEMVKKALDAYWQSIHGDGIRDMRNALEAVAPMLIAPYQRALEACNGALANSGAAYALALADCNKARAQGMREAAQIATNSPISNIEINILARAQEIDPK
jgi:hypothetical protein